METPITKQLQERIDDYHKFRHDEAMRQPQAIYTSKEIPWFKMPTAMRALPMNKREQALKEYEAKHGKYDWQKAMGDIGSQKRKTGKEQARPVKQPTFIGY